ncbi:UPF0158 family protein [Alicyclobacillus fastidiosus]|uniref:UPF0158 family protein n=1 Tax=Alicyclobacillus fastidiosus TaxID=392011 RepID=A0ABY6ZEP8_9BACL|nr:UPF0158 family protein [Alicyclobacillus fastidiosus]WAH41319.1 UPF0158 family protein [Alicyclobacillus fastidiosus]GMA62925.1 UPF0158 protein [Alicyclobacillus fastidiosus]
MIRVPADLNELCDAFAVNNEEIEHYLDIETGKVIMWMDPIATGIRDEELDDELENGFGERYFHLPKIESREAYQLMVEFTEALTFSSLRDRLEAALSGRKPFRAFKDVLYDFPEEREQWFTFERNAHRRQVLQWLELNHIILDSL